MSGFTNFLGFTHNIFVLLPILGILAAFGLGFLNLCISIFLDYYRDKSWVKRYKINSTEVLIDKFELLGFVALIETQMGVLIAIITGIFSAGSVLDAITDDLLEPKLRLSIYIFFVLWVPIIMKLYIRRVFDKDIFQESPRTVSVLYLLPQLIALIFVIFITINGFQYAETFLS